MLETQPRDIPAGRGADAASLAYRISLGKDRRMGPPLLLTRKTRTRDLGVAGPAAVLEAAYRSGRQVTLSGKLAGERVYLGRLESGYNDGATVRRVGLDYTTTHPEHGEIAVYYIDTTRLEDAPKLAAAHRAHTGAITRRAMQAEARAQADEDRAAAPAEDGA